MSPENILAEQLYKVIRQAAEDKRKAFEQKPIPKIHICMATCGIASGALDTRLAFEEALAERGLEAQIHTTGCSGHCYAEPVVIIAHPESRFPPVY